MKDKLIDPLMCDFCKDIALYEVSIHGEIRIVCGNHVHRYDDRFKKTILSSTSVEKNKVEEYFEKQ